ncbi:MAG: hypothetical protein NT126_10440 [Bacteroidetes bacterium]|nr:hypothetical protein [Bacteroidota bacterium]
MKKIGLFLLISCFSVTLSFSQKAKVRAAYNYYKDPYNDYEKAKDAIDAATADDQSKKMELTWYYRGLIYSALFKSEKYGFLCDHCLEVAYESFLKAMEINPKNEWADEINVIRVPWLTNQIFGLGVDQFKSKKYKDALSSFEYALKISPGDTSIILNSAYSAEMAGNQEKSKQYYSRLVGMKYRDDKVYLALSNLYKQEKDTAKALGIIKDGRKLFADSLSLLLAEINIHLASGHNSEATEDLDAAIKKDPKNQSLYSAMGSAYDNLANPKDANGNDLPKPSNYSELMNKAEEVYKQGLSLNPGNFEINFNLGALYFNQAAEMANAANNIKSNDEFAKAKLSYEQKFKEAEPFLEKALELSPNDKSTLNSLKQLYVRTAETEKYNKVKNTLDGLR